VVEVVPPTLEVPPFAEEPPTLEVPPFAEEPPTLEVPPFAEEPPTLEVPPLAVDPPSPVFADVAATATIVGRAVPVAQNPTDVEPVATRVALYATGLIFSLDPMAAPVPFHTLVSDAEASSSSTDQLEIVAAPVLTSFTSAQ
jgi:hypothetical protein